MYTLNLTDEELFVIERAVSVYNQMQRQEISVYRTMQKIGQYRETGPVPTTFLEFITWLDGPYSDWDVWRKFCENYGAEPHEILEAMKKAAGL